MAAYLTTRLRNIDLGVLLPFLLGITAAHCYINPRPLFRYFAVAAPAAALLGILLEPLLSARGSGGDAIVLAFIRTNMGWQFAMFAFVVLSGYSSVLRRALSWRPLVSIGMASYSIYLIHEPLVQRVDVALPHSLLFDYIAGVTVSVVCGFAFWYIFERPWVYGSLRRMCLPQLEAGSGWLLSRLDIPSTFVLRASGSQRDSPRTSERDAFTAA